MISENKLIDFENTRFILYDHAHKSENVISLEQVHKFRKEENIPLTKNAKNAIEEAEEQAWYDHYVGRAEELSRQNAKTNDTF